MDKVILIHNGNHRSHTVGIRIQKPNGALEKDILSYCDGYGRTYEEAYADCENNIFDFIRRLNGVAENIAYELIPIIEVDCFDKEVKNDD